MKKNLLFFILAISLINGIAKAAITGAFGNSDLAYRALNAAVSSGNPEEAIAVLERLKNSNSTVQNDVMLKDLIQRARDLSGRSPILPAIPVGLTQEVKDAAAAVKTAAKAVQDAGKALTAVQKAEVNNLAGITILK